MIAPRIFASPIFGSRIFGSRIFGMRRHLLPIDPHEQWAQDEVRRRRRARAAKEPGHDA